MKGIKNRFFSFCRSKKIIECFAGIMMVLYITYIPTGWFYDLWAGTGTGQGQWPNEEVQLVRGQEDIFPFLTAKTPATVTTDNLVRCSLMRLRDLSWKGEHYSEHGKHFTIEEYNSTGVIPFALPTESMMYNRYYLMELEDGTWIAGYFDDYLMLTNSSRFPTGYIRHASSQESRMLSQMAKDYDVNIHYVLDMYRHGKVSLSIDLILRILSLFGIIFIVSLPLCFKREKGQRSDPSAFQKNGG